LYKLAISHIRVGFGLIIENPCCWNEGG